MNAVKTPEKTPSRGEKVVAVPVPTEGSGSGSDEEKKVVETKSNVKSSKSQKSTRAKKPNGCQKCCSSFMKIVANDALYGSFFGPHPVSFISLCKPCRRCYDKNLLLPFCVASFATKLMYFIMLGVVMLLAAFFIVPWPRTILSIDDMEFLWPCRQNRTGWNKGCELHGGYFMAYRFFLSFITVMLTNAIIMVYITGTDEDPHRAKIHQGFWFYKYLYLISLFFLFFFVVGAERDINGVFEYVVSILGNIAHGLFVLVELIVIMDISEAWVIENRTSNSDWANALYWIVTIGLFVGDIVGIGYILFDFAFKREFYPGNQFPFNNCVEGNRYAIDWLHSCLIFGMIGLIMLVFFVTCAKEKFRKRFPYVGWMQTAVLTAFNLLYLWSALYSSPHVNSRPRCNLAVYYLIPESHKNEEEYFQKGSRDVYFRKTGLIHACLVMLGLVYYAFIHGPRTHTAPLSIAFFHVWGKESKVPVLPTSEKGPPEFQEVFSKLEVWKDEHEEVIYSWSKFYIMMALGGFSLMMCMTNFTNPWATDRYNSSIVALGFKYGSACLGTVIYLSLLVFPCSRIHPDYERNRQLKKLRSAVDQKAKDEENVPESEKVEEEDVQDVADVQEEVIV